MGDLDKDKVKEKVKRTDNVEEKVKEPDKEKVKDGDNDKEMGNAELNDKVTEKPQTVKEDEKGCDQEATKPKGEVGDQGGDHQAAPRLEWYSPFAPLPQLTPEQEPSELPEALVLSAFYPGKLGVKTKVYVSTPVPQPPPLTRQKHEMIMEHLVTWCCFECLILISVSDFVF